MQNRELGLPATNDLHADRHAILTRAEPHGNSRQAGHAQRRCRGHDAHDVYSLAVDQQLRLAMPEGRRRQYRSEQYVVFLEVLGVTILQPLRPLRGSGIVGAQLMARSRADISLYDSLIESYRIAGLLPA